MTTVQGQQNCNDRVATIGQKQSYKQRIAMRVDISDGIDCKMATIKAGRPKARLFSEIVLSALLLLLLLLAAPLPIYASKGKDYDLNSVLVHHLVDSVLFELNIGGKKVYAGSAAFEDRPFLRRYTFQEPGGRLYRYSGGIPLHITRRTAQMFVVAAILVVLLTLAARRIARRPFHVSKRFAGIVEGLFSWCRSDVAEKNMHGEGRGFHSYIASLFFFVLCMNLAGLFPPIGEALDSSWRALTATSQSAGEQHEGGLLLALWPGMTVTGDLSVTLSLALITTLLIWITGFRYQGGRYLWRAVPAGVPAPLYVIMWPLEFLLSPLAKGFALTIRLLANMTAGHVIILALLGFIFQSRTLWSGGIVSATGAAGIIFASVGGAVAIYFLEIMVAFLQAFIFTLLTALFIGSAMHRH